MGEETPALHGAPDKASGDDGNPLDDAFARLEAAMSRLERAATLKPSGDIDAPRLKQENTALRARVGDALRQLDDVLAELTSNGGKA